MVQGTSEALDNIARNLKRQCLQEPRQLCLTAVILRNEMIHLRFGVRLILRTS